MADMNAAVERVVKAWTDAGPVPAFHYEAMQRLQNEWPTLAEAIAGLCAEYWRSSAEGGTR